jgi:hypothetical protein
MFGLLKFKYYEYKIKKQTIKANRPVASHKAKPNTAYCMNWFFIWGFLAVAVINEPNTTPIPAPAPIKPEQATPAPIYLAAANIIKNMSE